MVKWGIEAQWISSTPPSFLCVYDWVVHGFECSCCQPDQTSTFLSFCKFNFGKKAVLYLIYLYSVFVAYHAALFTSTCIFLFASLPSIYISVLASSRCVPLSRPAAARLLLLSPWRHNTLPEEAVTPKYKHTLLKTQNTKSKSQNI